MGTEARERILDAARSILSEPDGRAAFTIGGIAAAAHVSRATLYRYFRSKTELLQAADASRGPGSHVAGTRVNILETALDLFAERGVHATTLSDIAERSGLSLSGIHWYYPNKDELIGAIAQYVPLLPTVAAEVAHAEAEGGDLETQLTHIAGVLLDILERRPGLVRLVMCESQLYPEVARLASAHTIGRALSLLARLFEQHTRAGRLRPGSAQARAQAFAGMFLILAALRPALASLLAPDDRETAQEYVSIILRGVLSSPEGAAG